VGLEPPKHLRAPRHTVRIPFDAVRLLCFAQRRRVFHNNAPYALSSLGICFEGVAVIFFIFVAVQVDKVWIGKVRAATEHNFANTARHASIVPLEAECSHVLLLVCNEKLPPQADRHEGPVRPWDGKTFRKRKLRFGGVERAHHEAHEYRVSQARRFLVDHCDVRERGSSHCVVT
jgi:hypothetical protein